jgi:hypothetical protein
MIKKNRSKAEKETVASEATPEEAVLKVIRQYRNRKEEGPTEDSEKPAKAENNTSTKTATAGNRVAETVDKLLPNNKDNADASEKTLEKPAEKPTKPASPKNLTAPPQTEDPEPQKGDVVPGLTLSPEAVARLEQKGDASTPQGAREIEDNLRLDRTA